MPTTVEHDITTLFREITFTPAGQPVDLDRVLVDFDNWDSISQIEMIVRMEERFATRFTEADLRDCRTLGDIIGAVTRKIDA